MIRTSTTHPLRIDSLPVANGELGLTLCPGKSGESVFGDAWNRDLSEDLDVLRAWGADAVVTLIEPHEFELLGVEDLGEQIEARGIAWHHFPIEDVSVPSNAAMEDWRALSPKLHAILESGGKVLVHCRGGLGRAGLVSALIVAERGHAARKAIEMVREARSGAVETEQQARWLERHTRHHGIAGLRMRCSLLGGAVGDSLGADIEFLALSQIRGRFPGGIVELPPHDGQRGAITDDTQMSLFTAEGLIRAQVRATLKGISDPSSVVHHALLRWFRTQGGTPQVQTDDIGLIDDPRLWNRRAPGNTCLSSLARSDAFGAAAHNDSKGCGTIMRVAPVALMCRRDCVRDIAIRTSALTHGHPTGQLAAAAWAEMLADVAADAALKPDEVTSNLEALARKTAEAYAQLKNGGETADAIRRALAALKDGSPETVETLGGGWVAEEALAIALYACLAGKSFEEGLRIAVTHSGDSDSTGAIAGNMLGLIYPLEVITHAWSECVEGSDIISHLVWDYLSFDQETFAAQNLSEAYPGW